MSKAVRIREHLYAEIEKLAKQERRSLISQLEVLLEHALALRDGYPDLAGSLSEREPRGETDRAASMDERHPPAAEAAKAASRSESDPHFKPDFK